MPRPKNIIVATGFSVNANRAGGNDLIVIGKHGGEVIDELLLSA